MGELVIGNQKQRAKQIRFNENPGATGQRTTIPDILWFTAMTESMAGNTTHSFERDLVITRTRARLLIEQLVAELESIGSRAADDLYWKQLDELMGCLGAEAANQTGEQEADQTVDEVEAWVAGNISGDGYESWGRRSADDVRRHSRSADNPRRYCQSLLFSDPWPLNATTVTVIIDAVKPPPTSNFPREINQIPKRLTLTASSGDSDRMC